jgi:hypothetical protein
MHNSRRHVVINHRAQQPRWHNGPAMDLLQQLAAFHAGLGACTWHCAHQWPLSPCPAHATTLTQQPQGDGTPLLSTWRNPAPQAHTEAAWCTPPIRSASIMLHNNPPPTIPCPSCSGVRPCWQTGMPAHPTPVPAGLKHRCPCHNVEPDHVERWHPAQARLNHQHRLTGTHGLAQRMHRSIALQRTAPHTTPTPCLGATGGGCAHGSAHGFACRRWLRSVSTSFRWRP